MTSTFTARTALAAALPLLLAGGLISIAPAAAPAAEPGSSTPSRATLAVPADDTVAPTLGIALPPHPASGWYDAPVTATVTASDTGSGVGAIWWNINGGHDQRLAAPDGSAEFSAPVTFASSGDYILQYWAIDRASNWSWRRDQTVKVDLEAPLLNVTSLQEGRTLRLNQVLPLDYSFADMHSGIAHWGVVVTGPSTGEKPALIQPGAPLPSSSAGPHTVKFQAVDNVGHALLKEMHYTVGDSVSVIATTPRLAFSTSSPRYNTALTATVTMRGSGSAMIPTGQVTLAIDGRSYRAALVNGTARIPLTRAIAAGTRTATVAYTSSDTGIFKSSTGTARLTVGKAKPKAAVKLSKSRIRAGARATATVSVSVPGSLGAKASGKVSIYDGKKRIATATVKNGRAKIKLPALKRGTHRITAKLRTTSDLAATSSRSVKLRVG